MIDIELLFGNRARHVPCWTYIQDQGDGVVSFVGASRTTDPNHPLRYGSERTHQFAVGEIILRPHMLIGTDALTGSGLAHLGSAGHDIEQMLASGEYIFPPTD